MIGRTTLALGVTTALVFGLTSVIHVEPIKAAWSGWTASQPPGNYVSEVLTLNVDSLGPPGYCELFVGDQQGSGDYQLSVRSYPGGLLDLATASASPPATGHRWLKFTLAVAYPESLIKGRRYEFHWSRVNGSRIQYYYNYCATRYDSMIVPGEDQPPPQPVRPALAMRCLGRLNAIDSLDFGAGEPDWWSSDTSYHVNPATFTARVESAKVRDVRLDIDWHCVQFTDSNSWYFGLLDASLGAIKNCPGGNAGHFPIFLSDVKVRHDRIVGLVERILVLHRQVPEAKTSHALESLERTIAATDKQISPRTDRGSSPYW